MLPFFESLIQRVRDFLGGNAALRAAVATERAGRLAAEETASRLRQWIEAKRVVKRRSPADWRFRVLRWEWVDVTFQPRDTAAVITRRALRLHIPLEDQHEGAPHWDITSKRMMSMVEPILDYVTPLKAWVHLRKVGDGPASSYTLRVEPIPS